MPVKIFSSESSEYLEKLVNEFFDGEPMIVNPKFHYSITSTGYFDPETKDGAITMIYSILISY